MKLRKINIAKDVEEVMNTKSIIDEYWINVTKETTQKTSVEEFVTRLDMAKTLYMSSKGDVVPFKHFDIDGTMYFFYVFEKNDLVSDCIHALEEFQFNFSKLTEVTDKEVMEGKLLNKNYFIVDNHYCIYE